VREARIRTRSRRCLASHAARGQAARSRDDDDNDNDDDDDDDEENENEEERRKHAAAGDAGCATLRAAGPVRRAHPREHRRGLRVDTFELLRSWR